MCAATAGIRRATAADAGAISELLLAAFAEYRPLYTAEAFAATTPPHGVIASRIEEGPIWVFVNPVVAGTLGALRKRDDLYLRSMAVHPRATRGGIGRHLLEMAEEHACEQGCSELVLSTTPFLLPAIALYERYGFRRTHEAPHDLFGTALFTMRKPVR